MKPVADALRGFEGHAIRYRWRRVSRSFEEVLGFKPARFYDAEAAAESAGSRATLDEMAK